MKISTGAICKLRVIDRESGKIVTSTPWIHNLVFDAGLNLMASNASFAGIFSICKVGSSSSPNVISSGAVTFTQTGNTITASSAFFTTPMNGGILKYGVGSSGLEQYITTVDSTHATSLTSFTQSSPISGVAYLVQQTSLVAYLYKTNSYQTGVANCGTTLTGSTCAMKRTFNFANQGSTYTVNEIGYASNNNNDGTCNGRIVPAIGVTVAPSQFLQVVIVFTYTVSPNSPQAVTNVGTNINTAGNIMFNFWDATVVDNNGNNTFTQGSFPSDIMDNCQNVRVGLMNATPPTQSSSIQNSAASNTTTIYQLGNFSISNSGQAVGVGLGTLTYGITTAGESCGGLIFGGEIDGSTMKTILTLNFTTPQTLPVGTFAGTLNYTNTFTRTLVN
jgi:hypothetical protein